MNDQPFPDVQGRCPACGWTTLFLANGGYITCSRADCPQPDAASTLLERDVRVTPADTANPAEPEPPSALTVVYATPPLLYTACDEGRHIAHPGETCDEHETDNAAMRTAWNRLMAPINEELNALRTDTTTED